jgi:hypothetical protein
VCVYVQRHIQKSCLCIHDVSYTPTHDIYVATIVKMWSGFSMSMQTPHGVHGSVNKICNIHAYLPIYNVPGLIHVSASLQNTQSASGFSYIACSTIGIYHHHTIINTDGVDVSIKAQEGMSYLGHHVHSIRQSSDGHILHKITTGTQRWQ